MSIFRQVKLVIQKATNIFKKAYFNPNRNTSNVLRRCNKNKEHLSSRRSKLFSNILFVKPLNLKLRRLGLISLLSFLPMLAHADDVSDAPASYGIASHQVNPEVRIGSIISNDPTGDLSSTLADADDDDGVMIPPLTQGQSATIIVNVNQRLGGNGETLLHAWIDWDGDGTFDQVNDRITPSTGPFLSFGTALSGTISINVTVPANAITTPTFARFRWAEGAFSAIPAFGIAPLLFPSASGEVEDYRITILSSSAPTLPNISIGSVTVIESTGTSSVPVTLSAPSAVDTVVTITTTAGSASSADFGTPTTLTVTIPAGQLTANVITPIVVDTLVETDEQFTINGTVSSDNTSNTDPSGTVTIVDDTVVPTPPSISIGSVTVNESTGTSSVPVTLSAPSAVDTVVRITTTAGSASTADFGTPTTVIVTIPAGQLTANAIIPIIVDTLIEPDEQFTVNGEVTSGITSNTNPSGTVTIIDDTPIEATDDSAPPLVVGDGSPNLYNVFNNDSLNNGPIVPANVVLNILAPATPINGQPVPELDPATGIVSVPPETPAGNYVISYQICEAADPTNCATAFARVNIGGATAVPTLSEWAMILLIMMLMGVGILKSRRFS